MLALMASMDIQRYQPRLYIVSEGDAFSAQKAETFELQHKVLGPRLTPPPAFLPALSPEYPKRV